MGQQIGPDSYFVLVEFKPKWRHSSDNPKKECKRIIEEIHRHVDEAEAKLKYEFECEYCERNWTESSSEYNGGCCDDDERNNSHA